MFEVAECKELMRLELAADVVGMDWEQEDQSELVKAVVVVLDDFQI